MSNHFNMIDEIIDNLLNYSNRVIDRASSTSCSSPIQESWRTYKGDVLIWRRVIRESFKRVVKEVNHTRTISISKVEKRRCLFRDLGYWHGYRIILELLINILFNYQTEQRMGFNNWITPLLWMSQVQI